MGDSVPTMLLHHGVCTISVREETTDRALGVAKFRDGG